ncbi:MAG TPA: RagB/SusD family nutrient uptake outer membrane protein [Gemmatimonadaceae bacterium]|nr:RagB/SusD family nutrient uptake outer membrane protein [Gemmatimonadaceae bacterium]
MTQTTNWRSAPRRLARKIAVLGCAAAIAGAAASCKDFLEPKPSDVLSPENFYHSAADAVAAVDAAYAQLPWADFWIWYVTDVPTDDIIASANFGADGHQLSNYTFDETLWVLNTIWGDHYVTINRANIVLDRVPSIVMDTTLRSRVLGEAHYIRALMYFDIVRFWGDAPLIEHEAKTVAEAQVARSPKADVYALIVSDLQAAAASLPESYSGTDIGRATSGAAKSLLAKVYLEQKDYNNAAKLAGEVMNSGVYHLNPVWKDNFRIATEFTNPESIFEVNYTAPEETPGGVGSVQTLFSLPQGYPGGDAYGLMQVTPSLVNLFASNDQRGNHGTFMKPPYTDLMGRTTTWGVPAYSKDTPGGAAFDKYLDETNTKDMTARAWQQQPNNWVIQRYADVLLIYAEAVDNGGAATAGSKEDALYEVAHRSNPNATRVTTNFTDSLRVERRKEFVFEGQRWFDLSRWGILNETFLKKTAEVLALFPGEVDHVYGVTKELMPIPSGQLTTNPKLTQNPGW